MFSAHTGSWCTSIAYLINLKISSFQKKIFRNKVTPKDYRSTGDEI